MQISKLNPQKALTLGILGGGQLAKMLAQAAYQMGLNISIIEKGENSPAGLMTKNEFTKGWDDPDELNMFIESADIMTLENEFINPDVLAKIAERKHVFPSAATMHLVQDKFIQKNTFASAGIPVPVYDSINSIEEAVLFGEKNGFPFLIKTRTLGYDGYGNFTVNCKEDINLAWDKFNTGGSRALMAEAFVPFIKELAVMTVRSRSGEIAIYPCVETIQKNHICHVVIAPATIDAKISEKAKQLAQKCVEAIDGVGVFGIELFLDNTGNVLVNEIAPRPHNSGHYTIEACYTSQYENAIRAILGLPLGSPEMIVPSACMINLLGSRNGEPGVPAKIEETLTSNKVSLHLYNKSACRTGRKMGHITVLGNSQKEAFAEAVKAADALVW